MQLSSSLFDTRTPDCGTTDCVGRPRDSSGAPERGCGQWPPWSTLVPSARRRETDRDARSQ